MPTEPRGARIDLEVNYPILPTQSVMIARSLAGLERPEVLDLALRHSTTAGTQAARTISAEFLSREDWSPAPINSSSPRTAGNASPRAGGAGAERRPLRRRGADLSLHQGHRRRLGVTLVPLAMDENGVRPDAVQKAHREAHLSALYVQPTIQNPLGMTMPQARRADLLRVVEKLGLPVIEDTVYGFLDEKRRWPRSRRIAASRSTACRRRWRPALRSASSFRRRACASASWPRFGRADGRLPDLPLPPDNG
jgi:hypothetical protein